MAVIGAKESPRAFREQRYEDGKRKPFRLQKPRPYAKLTFAFVQAGTLASLTIIIFGSTPALVLRVSSVLVVPYTTSSGRSLIK